MSRNRSRDYVNNKDFYDALVSYKQKCNEARERGEELPIIPNYIGECLQKISQKIGSRGNFSNYPFRDDMVQEGIENCLMYIENFDPEHDKKNPFGYFSRVIWWAFLRRIAKEKKELYTKYKSSQEMISMCETYVGGNEINLNLNTSADYINSFIEDYESKELEKKNKSKPSKDAE